MKKTIITTLLCIFLFSDVWGAEFFIAPGTNGSDANPGTESLPFRTVAAMFSAGTSGDTFTWLPGEYDGSVNGSIDTIGAPSALPPNGSLNGETRVFTLCRARDGIGTVYTNQRMRMGMSTEKKQYVKVDGMIFNGLSSLYNADYCYVKNCGFTENNGTNSGIFVIGTNDPGNSNNYNLVEDVFIVGASRIGGQTSNSRHNIWRRAVIRTDGSQYSSGNPSVGYTTYSAPYTSVQNIIVLDRIPGECEPGQDIAGVQSEPMDSFGEAEYIGCITLNSMGSGFLVEPASCLTDDLFTFKIIDSVAYGAAAWGIGINGFTGCSQHDVLVNHCAVYNSGSIGFRQSAPLCYTTISNNISEGSGGRSYYVSCLETILDNNQYFNNVTNTPSPTGTNNVLQNSSVTHITLPGSTAINGTDGRPNGPEIYYKIGVDGTFWGDPGYNEKTTEKLWPYPNEAVIKEWMSKDWNSSNEVRGFCANTTSLDGVSELTLSRYVWEIAGNEIPADIYGATPTYDAPIVTILTESQSTTAETITIIGTLTTDSALTGSGVNVNGVIATADDGTWDESIEAWTALGVTLSLGSNTITATGTDSNSGTDSDTTVVTRQIGVVSTQLINTTCNGVNIH